MMSLSSIYLDAFQASAHTGNFTRAAEKLHITQSALSQRISNLEAELETSLFIRDRSGIRLTEQGDELLRYCQARVAIETEVVERIRGVKVGELSGIIRIGAFSSVARSVILPALATILRDNPRLKLELISREMGELPKFFKSGEIDFMIVDQSLAREDVVTKSLGEETIVMVQKKGYKGEEVYLDHHEDDQVTFKYLRLRASDKTNKIERRYLDDVYGLIDGVKLGLGRAVLPRHLIRHEKDLVEVDRDRLLRVPIILHYYQRPYYSKLHEAVVQALTENTKKFL